MTPAVQNINSNRYGSYGSNSASGSGSAGEFSTNYKNLMKNDLGMTETLFNNP